MGDISMIFFFFFFRTILEVCRFFWQMGKWAMCTTRGEAQWRVMWRTRVVYGMRWRRGVGEKENVYVRGQGTAVSWKTASIGRDALKLELLPVYQFYIKCYLSSTCVCLILSIPTLHVLPLSSPSFPRLIQFRSSQILCYFSRNLKFPETSIDRDYKYLQHLTFYSLEHYPIANDWNEKQLSVLWYHLQWWAKGQSHLQIVRWGST